MSSGWRLTGARPWGGPADYTAAMGDHSHVPRLHAGNGEHAEMDRRALQCFALALDDAGLPGDPWLRRTPRRTLMDWFAQMATYPRSRTTFPMMCCCRSGPRAAR